MKQFKPHYIFALPFIVLLIFLFKLLLLPSNKGGQLEGIQDLALGVYLVIGSVGLSILIFVYLKFINYSSTALQRRNKFWQVVATILMIAVCLEVFYLLTT